MKEKIETVYLISLVNVVMMIICSIINLVEILIGNVFIPVGLAKMFNGWIIVCAIFSLILITIVLSHNLDST